MNDQGIARVEEHHPQDPVLDAEPFVSGRLVEVGLERFDQELTSGEVVKLTVELVQEG